MQRPSPYKLLLAAIVLAAFAARTMDGFLIVLDYYTHTAEYAKYCINKDNSAMHCNGQCQMFRKLKTQEKQDQNGPERKTDDKNDISLSSRSYFASGIPPAVIIVQKIRIPDLTSAKTLGRTFDIFHPPQI